MEIESNSAKELWKKALNYVLDNGEKLKDRHGRFCKEVLQLTLVLNSFLDIEGPYEKVSSFKEWVYPRIGEIKSIILDGSVGNSYVYSYGERIFNFKGFNQIDDYIIPLLLKDSNSRRAIISLWDPLNDSTKSQAPGLVLVDFKVRNNKLYLFSIIRSNDLFIGLPANLVQLHTLANYVSKKLNVEIGVISITSTSAHLFLDNLDEIKSVI